MNEPTRKGNHEAAPIPYGLWPSPFAPRSMGSSVRLSDVQWDAASEQLVWLEHRAGQSVLVAADPRSPDAPRDLTADLAIRARVGYGGGDFAVGAGSVVFVEKSGRLFRLELAGGQAHPITPAFGNAAAPAIAPNGTCVIYVHSYEDSDVLAIADLNGTRWGQILVRGHDFYMQPCWHPNAKQIAYIAWNHPQMPWDGCTLYLATLHQPERPHSTLPDVAHTQVIAGGESVSIFQPSFSPDGRWLAYISDERGWGQIHLYDMHSGKHHQLTHAHAEHGTPAWVQGLRTYAWSHDSTALYVIRNEQGFGRLFRQSVHGDPAQPISELGDYTWLEQPASHPHQASLALIASSSQIPPRLLLLDGLKPVPPAPLSAHPASPRITPRILRRTQSEMIAADALASAQPVTWKASNGATVHGLLYLPPRSTTRAPAGDIPPAIIRIHGGPTSQAVASWQRDAQFFATRGFVVLYVNYRGSTGYGRAYMEALRNNWGIIDVEDTISAAHFLSDQHLADPQRLVVMGGSAGGYTVLETLCQAAGTFRAGICSYGVSNLFTLVADTHKFEAHYLDSLIGELPAASEIYRERSPVFHAEQIRDPLAIFQGDEDTVVPRNQSDAIVAALKRNGVPHEYHIFAGEGHGWRKPETIEQFYTAVEAFLRQYVLYA